MLIGATLGRYFAMRFVRTILGVFLTVFTLVYTLDFVELLRRAGDAEGASTGLMAQLSLYRTPAVAEGVLPFAILFGSMAALLQLSRKLELVVARAAGISAWQFLQPGAFVALAIGAFTVGVYNPVSALMKQRSTEIEAKIFSRSTKANSGKDLWIRQRGLDGQAILRADTAIEGTTTLAGVSVFTFDDAGTFTAQIEAARADSVRAAADYARQQQLEKVDFVAKARIEQARADRDRTQAAEKGAEASLVAMKAQVEVLRAQRAEAESLAAELRTAERRAARDLAFTVLHAPFDGVIGNKAVEAGDRDSTVPTMSRSG